VITHEEKRAIGKEKVFRMMNQDSELDAFKREIDLREFAVSLGYEIDRRESWRGSTVLRRGADKIVVKRNGNGHYVFFSVRDDRDNGTVIDLLQRRQNLGLGAVRQILRPWIGRPAIFSQFHADDAGRQLVEVIREAVANVAGRGGRSDLILKSQRPAKEGEDWNQVLQNVVLKFKTGLANRPDGRVKQVRPE
jgi:hypothetical protein